MWVHNSAGRNKYATQAAEGAFFSSVNSTFSNVYCWTTYYYQWTGIYILRYYDNFDQFNEGINKTIILQTVASFAFLWYDLHLCMLKCDPKWNSSLRRIAEASSIKRVKWTIKQQMLNWSKTSKQGLLQSGSSWGSTHSPLGGPLVPMSKELNLEMFLVNQPVIGLISSILL